MKNWKSFITDFFAAVGFLMLMVEVAQYFFPDFTKIRDHFLSFIVISVLFGICKNRPRNSFTGKIRDKDSWVELKIGDAFSNKGALVVPINNELDLYLGGNVKKAKSILNKLLMDYFDSKEEHLKSDLAEKLSSDSPPFPIGKAIEIEQKGKRFYLLVNSTKNENNRVSSTFDDFLMALNGLWDFLSSDASKGESVSIPLINTQHGRNSLITRNTVIKHIIDTFIDASKYKCICEKLIISIHPSDIQKGDLDFDQLCEYLEFQCKNYKDIKFDIKAVGKEIESSVISTIEA